MGSRRAHDAGSPTMTTTTMIAVPTSCAALCTQLAELGRIEERDVQDNSGWSVRWRWSRSTARRAERRSGRRRSGRRRSGRSEQRSEDLELGDRRRELGRGPWSANAASSGSSAGECARPSSSKVAARALRANLLRLRYV